MESIEDLFIREARADGITVTVVPAEEWEIPTIDYTLWEDRATDAQTLVGDILVKYLEMPYLRDDAPSHKERRALIGRLETTYESRQKELSAYRNNNALRRNPIGLISTAAQLLTRWYVGEDKSDLEARTQRIRDLTDVSRGYDDLDAQAKFERAQQIKKEVYGLLTYLNEQKAAA